MEPAALLFVEVFGMIAIAGFLTVALVRARPLVEGAKQEQDLEQVPEQALGGVQEKLPVLSTTMLCPTWGIGAEVALGLDSAGPKPRLEILSCDLLLDLETCDRACVGGIAQG
jgi:hypothetical protein